MNAKFANETRQLIKKRKKAPKSGLTLNDLYDITFVIQLV